MFKKMELVLVIFLFLGVSARAGTIKNSDFEEDSGWQFRKNADLWQGTYDKEVFRTGRRSYLISFPARTLSGKGQYAEIYQRVNLSPADKGISFFVKDTYTGPTKYYHRKQLLLDKKIIWEEDAAGGDNNWEKIEIDLTPYVTKSKKYTLGFRVYDNWCVDNFNIKVWIDNINLLTEKPVIKRVKKEVKLPDWFSKTMINETLYTREPVEGLKGRVFMFFTSKWGYDETRVRAWMHYLKRLGFTDIVYNGLNSGNTLGYPTDLPLSKPSFWLKNNFPEGADPLKMLCEACKAEGLNLWLMGHTGTYDESMCARDEKGNLYLYGKRPIDDFLSPKLKKYLTSLFQDIMKKYGKYNVLEGYYYDEPFFTWVDFHGAHIDKYIKFCEDRFGETPPSDIVKKFALRGGWRDPDDKWWRRYILFNNWVNTDFHQFLTEELHKVGLRSMVELRPSAVLGMGWASGMDIYQLTRIGADCYFVAAGDYCEPGQVYPTAYTGDHVGNTWGFYQTYCFRGKPGSFFEAHKLLHSYHTNPKETECTKQYVRNIREWDGGKSLTRTAVLTNQNTLLMRFKDARKEANKEVKLFRNLSFYLDMNMLLSQETDLYKNYRVLVAPPYSLSGLSDKNINQLIDFIRKGGLLIDIKAPIISSLPDLTKEKSHTREICGLNLNKKEISVTSIRIGSAENRFEAPIRAFEIRKEELDKDVKVLAYFKDNLPAVIEKRLGKGKVITFLFNIMDARGKTEKRVFGATHDLRIEYQKEIAADKFLVEYLVSLMHKNRVEIKSDGNLRIMNTLKKNNWIGIALWGDDFPLEGKISVDIENLGVKSEGYRVYLLSRNHEYLKDYGGYEYWSAEDLKRGLDIRIPKDNAQDKELTYIPTGHPAGEHMYGMWKRRPFLRAYEHEILVIAPYDELTIEGEK